LNNNRIYLPNTHIEIITPELAQVTPRRAVFDFDGTISLIREGWQEEMISLMVKTLRATPRAEDEASLVHLMRGYVARSTGQHTIQQMKYLGQEVRRRGGQPKPPAAYKQDYLAMLHRRVDGRKTRLKSGQVDRVELTVPGVLELLAALQRHGLSCTLASGTDELFVIEEAILLGVAHYFDGGIYGARDDGQAISKKRVIEKILRNQRLHASELLVIGDGPDEITHAATAGCIAVGVASNETERKGINEIKREQLIEAGANLIIPDFREYRILLQYLHVC
jgi:phosphoglycolate phosphatase-like HAD superfamily hydrolase